jgi:nondiscriminating glutamyl-tRNA synthetase
MTIRTRFAPSPTGFLHIGGVRTALFNWLLTRRHGGKFILRIDDTDAERNRPEALQPILDGFRWLGIHWDEGPEVGGPCGPYFQSQRDDRYRSAALKLLESGHAYPDYLTKEEVAADRIEQALKAFRKAKPNASDKELEAERKAATQGNRPYTHRGPHRETPPAECVRMYREKPTTLRLKVPLGVTIKIKDLIRGEVEWQTDLIGDPVILRADGRALYNFATVIDDVDMKITHVIRAAEHLDNTKFQVPVYQALGLPLPEFAHVPVVNEPGSKKKLSKRDMKKFVTPEIRAKLKAVGWTDAEIDAKDDLNPATVAYYRELGYLPAALVNYLGRLGWSMDDKSEIIPLEQMTAHFSLERVNDSPASFDPDKLYWLAGEYMRMLPVEERVAGVIPYLVRAKLVAERVDEPTRNKLRRIVEACGDRLKLFSDILTYGAFFFRDPVYDPQGVKKRVQKEGMPALLKEFAGVLANIEPFEPAKLEQQLHAFCESRGIKQRDMIHALRVSTTGVTVGPGVYECLAILGREETQRRIELALKQTGGA